MTGKLYHLTANQPQIYHQVNCHVVEDLSPFYLCNPDQISNLRHKINEFTMSSSIFIPLFVSHILTEDNKIQLKSICPLLFRVSKL
jgi:hypothetical protein